MQPGWATYELILPAESVEPALNELELGFANAAPGESGDSRRVAAAFDFVELGPNDGRLEQAAWTLPELDASTLTLPAGSGLRFLLRPPDDARLEIGVACAPGWAPAEVAVRIGSPLGGRPKKLFQAPVCLDTVASENDDLHVDLPDAAGRPRDLYVLNP